MKSVYIAFANSNDNPLPSLRDEYDNVKSSLNERYLKGDFILNHDPFTTTDKIITTLRNDNFRNNLVLFLYSGHANRDHLLLEDGLANADGIAGLLGRCPNLSLVVLNGCSTAGQVDALLNKNIPVVIATSAPIDDRRATQFSMTFFQELAQNKSSIREAFARAIDAAKVYGSINPEIRSRAIGEINEMTQPLWGLYYQEINAKVIDTWRLPEKIQDDKTNLYLENAINGIFENYKDILEQQGEDATGQDVILKRLPFTISEPIRKLLAPRDASGNIFYDQASPERYKMMLYAYHNIIALMAYILLAQLWEEKQKSRMLKNMDALLESVQKWLTIDFVTENQISLLPLFNLLVQVYKDTANKIPFFLSEMEELIANLTDPDTKDAVSYLEAQMTNNNYRDLETLCDKTEQSLSVVLFTFGFLINYGLTSIKDINVLFYMDSASADFEHKVVKLQQTLTKLDDRSELDKTYFKTASILLRRIDRKEEYLNLSQEKIEPKSDLTAHKKKDYLYLSPFLIDENAYTRTPKAKLCYFMAYDKTNKRFHFRHVSKPDDIIPIEKKKTNIMAKIRGDADNTPDYFPLINGQFAAFYATVFGKSLSDL